MESNFVFYERFAQLCKEKGVTAAQVSRDAGIGQSTISMWRRQGTQPSAPALIALADYFNTTPAYLMGNDMAKEPLDDRIKKELSKLFDADGNLTNPLINKDGTVKHQLFPDIIAEYFMAQTGRKPTEEELDKVLYFLDTLVKGMDDAE